MAVVRCESGHFYDDEKFTNCPHCENDLPSKPRQGLSDAKTVFGASMPGVAGAAMRQHLRVDLGGPAGGKQDEKTVGIFRTAGGGEPVVGWLVCVQGSEQGRDYRLHAGRNFIGRGLKSDIALVDDARITAEDHCSIVYEPRQGVFVLARGKGDGVLINGERLQDTCQLAADDRIEIGASAFVFVPFCREGRTW